MIRFLLIALLIVAGLYLAASPYITAYQMQAAADARDSEALSRHVDFDSVRDSLRVQFHGRLADETAGVAEDHPLGAAIGGVVGGAVIDRTLDAYVTPDGIAALMRGEDPGPAGPLGGAVGERLEDVEPWAGYRSLNRFAIVLTDPETAREAEFILSRRNLGWKLTEIHLPLD